MWGAQFLHKSRTHFLILGARRLTPIKFYTEDPKNIRRPCTKFIRSLELGICVSLLIFICLDS